MIENAKLDEANTIYTTKKPDFKNSTLVSGEQCGFDSNELIIKMMKQKTYEMKLRRRKSDSFS